MRKILSLAIAFFWMLSLVAQKQALNDTKIPKLQKKEKLSEQEFLNLSEKERDALGIFTEPTKVKVIKGTTFSSKSYLLNENFDNGVPPAGWANFENGAGNYTWNSTTTNAVSGNCAVAYYQYSGGDNEQWLVTTGLAIAAGQNSLSFYTCDHYSSNYSSTLVVKVSTTDQTTVANFTDVLTLHETDVTTNVMTQKTVDLSIYNGDTIYIAFVMYDNDGDNWYIDNAVIGTPPANDQAVTQVFGEGQCYSSSASPVMFTVANLGIDDQSSVQAHYSIDGGSNWTAYETFTYVGPISIGEDTNLTFTTPATLPAGPINLQVEIQADEDNSNNIDSVLFTIIGPITSFPFLEDFETSNNHLNLWDTTRSSVDLTEDAFNGSGVLLFQGGANNNWSGGSTSTTYTQAWVNNVTHHAKAYTCNVDATTANPSNFYLTFDLRQTYSYGPNYNWFRVMLYGADTVQLVDIHGDSNYLPQQQDEDVYKNIYMDLSTYAGQSFVLSFQNSAKYDLNNVYPADNSYFDNFYLGELPTNDIAVGAFADTVILANNDSLFPSAQLQNKGTATQHNVPVNLTFGSYNSTVVVDSIVGLTSLTVYFDTVITSIGMYNGVFSASLAGDEDTTDNSDTFFMNVLKWSAGLPDIADGSYVGSSAYMQNDTARLLYAFGGNRESSNYAAFNVLNVNTGTWYNLPDAPSGSIFGAATVLQNKVLAYTGYDGTAYVDSVYFYDIASASWMDAANLPAVLGWTSMTTVGNNAYLAGGVDNNSGSVVNSVYRFDGTAWTIASEMPGVRYGGSLINVGGKLVYVQGADDTTINKTVFIGTIDASSADTIVWVESSACPVGVFKMTAVALNDHALMFTGGNDGANGSYWHALPNTWIYDLTSDTWTEKDAKPQPVLGYFAGAYTYGPDTVRYVVASGYDANTVGQNLNVEYYDYINYGVTFNVTDGTNAIQGATININGTTLTTSANGKVSIDLNNGSYAYTVSKALMTTVSDTITIASNFLTENVVLNFLAPQPLVYHPAVNADSVYLDDTLVGVKFDMPVTLNLGEVYITYNGGNDTVAINNVYLLGNDTLMVDHDSLPLLGTTYTVKVVANAVMNNTQGNEEFIWSFVTMPDVPVVTTEAATNIDQTTATINGTIDPNGNNFINVYFEYGLTTAYGDYAVPADTTAWGGEPLPFFANISGLTVNTQYHYRIVGIMSNNDTIEGADMDFTTLNLPAPVFTTDAATAIDFTTATLNGTVDANSNSVTDISFLIGTTTGVYTDTVDATPNVLSSDTAEAVEADLTGLTHNTQYFYRVYGMLGAGVYTGTELSFTTLNPTLSVTPPTTNVTTAAGTTNFTVAANQAWTAASDQTWCTVTPSGTGNGTITATYTENTGFTARTATITVTGGVAGTQTVTVVQAAVVATLAVTPPSQSVTNAAGNTAFTVAANQGWTAASNQTWCTVTPSGTGNGTITATYTANTGAQRTATITVTGAQSGTQTVTVVQAGITTYTVTFGVQGTGGTVEARLGSQTGTPITSGAAVPAGDTIYFIATPSNGYEVADWIYNGTPTGLTGNVVVETGLAENITVMVVFQPDAIQENSLTNINMYPNPAKEMFTITSDVKMTNIRIMNLIGETVYANDLNDVKTEINVSNFAEGTYFVVISSENGQATRKFQVVK